MEFEVIDIRVHDVTRDRTYSEIWSTNKMSFIPRPGDTIIIPELETDSDVLHTEWVVIKVYHCLHRMEGQSINLWCAPVREKKDEED